MVLPGTDPGLCTSEDGVAQRMTVGLSHSGRVFSLQARTDRDDVGCFTLVDGYPAYLVASARSVQASVLRADGPAVAESLYGALYAGAIEAELFHPPTPFLETGMA